MTEKIKICDAIAVYGSVAKLAKGIGYTRARVYQWISEGKEYLPELAEFRYRAEQEKADTNAA